MENYSLDNIHNWNAIYTHWGHRWKELYKDKLEDNKWKICIICDKEHDTNGNDFYTNGGSRFCSCECYNKYCKLRERYRAKSRNLLKLKTDKVCKYTGTNKKILHRPKRKMRQKRSYDLYKKLNIKLIEYKIYSLIRITMDNKSYLNSLPDNITKLDVSNRGLTSLDVRRFTNLKVLNCRHNHLTSLHLNEELHTLYCANNHLTSLHLNEELHTLYCSNNPLTSLYLNKNLQQLCCGENCLSSLHLNEKDNITKLDVSNRGLTSLDVRRFTNLKVLYCAHNHLTSLHLNEKLIELYCSNNQLTSLHLPETLQRLDCFQNQLTSLHLNKNLQKLCCGENCLSSLHLNEELHTLYCSYNQLTSLYLNEELHTLYCSNNQLTSLYLNEKLQIIYYHCNPICEIIDDIEYNDKDKIKQKMRVLNQFRYLYYCLKFKKRFRDLLWVKIREPKIRIKYSPKYLLENLYEDIDLDELLKNW